VQPAVRSDTRETVVTDGSDGAETMVTNEPRALDPPQPARQLAHGSPDDPENPVQVIHPDRQDHPGG
jgi:hypothetical protein